MSDTISWCEIVLNGNKMSRSTTKNVLKILGSLLAIPSGGLFLWGGSLYLSNAVRFEDLQEDIFVCGTSALGGVVLMLVSSPILLGGLCLIWLSRGGQPLNVSGIIDQTALSNSLPES